MIWTVGVGLALLALWETAAWISRRRQDPDAERRNRIRLLNMDGDSWI